MKLVGFPGDPIQTLMKMKIMSDRGGKEVWAELPLAPPTSLVEDRELPRDFPYEEDSRPRSQSSKAATPPPV